MIHLEQRNKSSYAHFPWGFMQILHSTRTLLRQWGRWARPPNIGFPSYSPMFHFRIKSSLYAPTSGPREVLEVDAAVSALELKERVLLIERYQWQQSKETMMQKNGWSKSTYYRKLEEAEWGVHCKLGRSERACSVGMFMLPKRTVAKVSLNPI